MKIILRLVVCSFFVFPLSTERGLGADLSHLPDETLQAISAYLTPSEVREARLDRNLAQVWNPVAKKIKRVQELIDLDQFISIPNGFYFWKEASWISPIGVTQALWVAVMEENPSHFKEPKYCPESYAEENGIPMCADFPVDGVPPGPHGRKKVKTNDEFLRRLNQLFALSGHPAKFRRASAAEYIWADTAGGRSPKRASDPDLWKYTIYGQISDRDPLDLEKPSASGEQQIHAVRAKLPNVLGFYRSAVMEWVSNQALDQSSLRNWCSLILTGQRSYGAWTSMGKLPPKDTYPIYVGVSYLNSSAQDAESGLSSAWWRKDGCSSIGAARLVVNF